LNIKILFEKKMPTSFKEITDKLWNFIRSGFNRDFAINLLQSLYGLPQSQQQIFADNLNDHIMRVAPEVTGNVCPLEGAKLKYLWELYIYRAIWYVCCDAKDQGEILSVDSPCIIVLFVCLKMEEGYNISDVLLFFHENTTSLEICV
jgi:hypothetical protein